MAKIVYNNKSYDIPKGKDAFDVLEELKAVMPELNNATLTKEKDNYTVQLQYGKKG
jgi:hypothetical protein